jgi:hypothetical protein
VELKEGIKDLSKQQSALDKEFSSGGITREKYVADTAKIVQAQETLKANAKELITVIKTETKENISLKGSMDERRSASVAKDLYRQLSQEERDNVKVGGELLKSIQMQDAELKKLDANIGNYQRNVGNYKSGMAGFESLDGKVWEAQSRISPLRTWGSWVCNPSGLSWKDLWRSSCRLRKRPHN